ncbi:MAG: hypothetical protein ABWZ25_19970 [Chitinophagaceae bacterium]
MGYLEPYTYFIFIALILSLRVYWVDPGQYSYLSTFPIFLATTLAVELIGIYTSYRGLSNTMLYNIFSFLECCYFLWLISRMIQSRIIKTVIRVAILVYTVGFIINITFFQVSVFHTITYSIGNLMIVLSTIQFFLELFRTPKSVPLVSNPNFWICSALLFWGSCSIPLYGFINFLAHNSPLVLRNFGPIVTILNIFLYSLFSIAFICMKTRKYSSLP